MQIRVLLTASWATRRLRSLSFWDKPIQDLFFQASNFVEEILKIYLEKDDVNILVVGHNAILRCLILLLLGKPKQGFRKIRL